ncbi:hypothetical protein ABD91_20765 [Lysinibacillus sphaericus]|uniref:hypothetical protein n=1 Tax=Lysinibacillus sphaericus TaxID=1421 RepID=UPI0018CF429D|nr:hypothetical protein [Lysinibacillus sphaericus]MBG9693175.1 hypothetical protein [Lysinibacillus sphaericus]
MRINELVEEFGLTAESAIEKLGQLLDVVDVRSVAPSFDEVVLHIVNDNGEVVLGVDYGNLTTSEIQYNTLYIEDKLIGSYSVKGNVGVNQIYEKAFVLFSEANWDLDRFKELATTHDWEVDSSAEHFTLIPNK